MRVVISARKGHSSPDKFTHYVAVARAGASTASWPTSPACSTRS